MCLWPDPAGFCFCLYDEDDSELLLASKVSASLVLNFLIWLCLLGNEHRVLCHRQRQNRTFSFPFRYCHCSIAAQTPVTHNLLLIGNPSCPWMPTSGSGGCTCTALLSSWNMTCMCRLGYCGLISVEACTDCARFWLRLSTLTSIDSCLGVNSLGCVYM